MAYSSDIARLLTGQFTKFATLNRHQLVGQVANLDFWTAEVRHCFSVTDGYQARFEQLKAAQTKYVSEHQTIEFDLRDPCCIRGSAAPPKRVPQTELREARRSLAEAMYHFLVRCFREGLIEEGALRQECEGLGINVEATDLKYRSRAET